ncbi:MAG: TetR/AcrR family transcriptional regulator [Kordiimonadaceae bacterium]|nr:TetR/AcrR family transcriptional regulator [Kordiimonadaceae bacterium]
MIHEEFFAKAMGVFIRYGFRKTSMDDIATAAGLSRQAIYNRYGNKEALFTAVIDAAVQKYYRNARVALEDSSRPLKERLLEANMCSAGEYIEALRSSPHSYEVIALASAEAGELADTLGEEFNCFAAELLLNENVFIDTPAARDALFVIETASNGLLHKAKTLQEYHDGMETVIRTVVPDTPKTKLTE